MSHEAGRGTITSYTIGFVASIVLTIAAYSLVMNNNLSAWGLVAAIIALAVAQLFVQLVFFLHFGRESRPRWNLVAFLFMLIVVVIVVFGSLWIMANLSYHHGDDGKPMTPKETDSYILEDEGVKKHHRSDD